jgi:hypothetical protein
MSLTVGNIISPNLVALQSTVLNQSTQIQNLINLYSDNVVSFDQVTKQNVVISFNEASQRYRFQMSTENNVFMYQVWKKNNDEMNSHRTYMNKSLRQWISLYNNSMSNYTPTTLIEINNVFYPTVMTGALIEGNDCVFYFDSRPIISSQNLPQSGSYNNVRFDIDDNQIGGGVNQNLTGIWTSTNSVIQIYSNGELIISNVNVQPTQNNNNFVIYNSENGNAVTFNNTGPTSGFSYNTNNSSATFSFICVNGDVTSSKMTVTFYYKDNAGNNSSQTLIFSK